MPMAHPATRRRYTRLVRVLLSDQQETDLRARAAASDLSLSATLRQLLISAAPSAAGGASAPALACLVAAEHVRLLLEAMVPGGPAASERLREKAARAAERRLADLTAEVAPGGQA